MTGLAVVLAIGLAAQAVTWVLEHHAPTRLRWEREHALRRTRAQGDPWAAWD